VAQLVSPAWDPPAVDPTTPATILRQKIAAGKLQPAINDRPESRAYSAPAAIEKCLVAFGPLS
jgi:hypothetical protein